MSRAADGLTVLTTIAFFGVIFWLYWQSKRPKRHLKPVPDNHDQPYTAFTREFDLELFGSEVERRLIGASPDYQSGWLKLGKDQWRRNVEIAKELLEQQREVFQNALGEPTALRGAAFTILIDQSGSMRDDPMRWAAVASRLAAESLTKHGCTVEILGFSTAGWRGGFAYQKWQHERRPKRPGRLCALLHIIYKAADEDSLTEASWEAMLNPNALRENVDGEALEWAAGRLRALQAVEKHLIILSDGAPVDDATLMHNGLGYLVRHARNVIAGLEGDSSIDLSAIGIRHAVDEYYSRSVQVEDVTKLPIAMANWLSNLARDSR